MKRSGCLNRAENLPATFGERVRELRKQQNLTMDDLASITGVSKSTIGRIEKGASVSTDYALLLSDFFGVSLDFLFGRTNHPTKGADT
ncbi:MAG: helix-turn-helix transcriptional regulator [Clostridia bacterium]|nr:helix-turn-helix transcriptional regulator [Clostridia bacterium]